MDSLVILISGRGSNMEAILKQHSKKYNITVISNNPRAEGLEIAKFYGANTIIFDNNQFVGRVDFDFALSEIIDRINPKLIVLAGFLRVLGEYFVNKFYGKLINIHPSLLPEFKGLHTHERVLKQGVKVHGCTVHFVSSELDAGPIISQSVVPVLQNDNVNTLANRVLQEEHILYPRVVDMFMQDKIILKYDKVEILG